MNLGNGTLRGFGLTEALVGMVISSVVLAGAYRLTSGHLQTGARSLRSSKNNVEIEKFLGHLTEQTANVVPILGGTSTKIGNNAPLTYAADPDVCTPRTIPGSFISWGLIPYPGKTKSQMPTDLSTFDPSVPLDSTQVSDGLRIISLMKEAGTSRVTEATTSDDIIVEAEDGTFAVGDYALIFQGSISDFFRITDVHHHTPGHLRLTHGSASTWNQTFTPSLYGVGTKPTYVQKVSFIDYAFDPTEKVLYYDDHVLDGTGRIVTWHPLAQHVTAFRVWYQTADAEIPIRTRTPRMGDSTDLTPCGTSQIGFPNLKRIEIELVKESASETIVASLDQKTILRDVRPENLRRPYGGADTLYGSPLSIIPPPDPGCPSCTGVGGSGQWGPGGSGN